ncbi:MAG: hypothetical protein J6X92_04615 [Bacteroidales bacterium]|nr:hypothetical protein [Bacteroidales bacterium]
MKESLAEQKTRRDINQIAKSLRKLVKIEEEKLKLMKNEKDQNDNSSCGENGVGEDDA